MIIALNVDAALKTLERMTVTALRERYAEVFGEATRSFNKRHLVKRIVWRMQANAEGGLSERALRRARELANDADLRLNPPRNASAKCDAESSLVSAPLRFDAASRLPMPGTLLRRTYKGRMYLVRVLQKGFEFDGEVYRSLSAVAYAITGAHWSGTLFFGLASDRRREAGDGKERRAQ
ncbi:MAG: DUF2924 domain-containing protein [Phycisphaerales bacterium]|nr:DUF2924 domain-containing protein [Phycisphaerales bacterium]